MTEQDWDQLRDHCRSSFRKGFCAETEAIGLIGENRCQGRPEYLLAKLLLPGLKDLRVASYGELVFDASYIRRAHLKMRRANLAGLAFFHTHPYSIISTPALCVTQERWPLAGLEFLRCGTTKPREGFRRAKFGLPAFLRPFQLKEIQS